MMVPWVTRSASAPIAGWKVPPRRDTIASTQEFRAEKPSRER